ncbi:hypothetical protein KIH86_17705 [Paenibacillus sp. HN-1]|uniref:hypothetical protein n=1 Tax=Paenibacillus TaxID=44249 RepID=UPI001CA8EAB2|nr:MULTISPECIES: hypothetical protein [Paenibacillus]MBY9078295.1 hypothetical protein [Paenibacillus sp. CGMCC 1.18879]MBY9086046.1 hypothetical protein [Paenibacillus sinensis]
MLSEETAQRVDKLVQAVANRALKVYEAGGSDPAALEALASLITAARGDPPDDNSPVIGFIVHSRELEDDE